MSLGMILYSEKFSVVEILSESKKHLGMKFILFSAWNYLNVYRMAK